MHCAQYILSYDDANNTLGRISRTRSFVRETNDNKLLLPLCTMCAVYGQSSPSRVCRRRRYTTATTPRLHRTVAWDGYGGDVDGVSAPSTGTPTGRVRWRPGKSGRPMGGGAVPLALPPAAARPSTETRPPPRAAPSRRRFDFPRRCRRVSLAGRGHTHTHTHSHNDMDEVHTR